MRAALAFGVALAALALLAPSASAHVESYSQAKPLQAGPYLLFFEPRPQPPFAGEPLSLVAQVSSLATSMAVADAPVSIEVQGPDGFQAEREMLGEGTGYFVSSITPPAAGNYSMRLSVRDRETNESHSAQTEIEVFPDIPYRLRPVDQALDVYTGQRVRLAFEVYDPDTLTAKELADLHVRLEHWSDDHSVFYDAQEMAAEKVSAGVWRVDATFPQPGMYHVRFSSAAGGFNYADVPLFHIYAITPEQAGVEREAPAMALPVLLAALGLLALARRRA